MKTKTFSKKQLLDLYIFRYLKDKIIINRECNSNDNFYSVRIEYKNEMNDEYPCILIDTKGTNGSGMNSPITIVPYIKEKLDNPKS